MFCIETLKGLQDCNSLRFLNTSDGVRVCPPGSCMSLSSSFKRFRCCATVKEAVTGISGQTCCLSVGGGFPAVESCRVSGSIGGCRLKRSGVYSSSRNLPFFV